MWKQKNSLNNKILKYFLLFSILILGILWILQFVFFKYFYKNQKINDIKTVAYYLKKNKDTNKLEEKINKLAYDRSVCIEIANNNYDLLYSSTFYGKECFTNFESTSHYKYDFINNNNKEQTYQIKNPKLNNDILIYALKLNNNRYAFINTSIEPVDSMIFLIKKQLIVISLLVIILSFIIAYFIANYISKPINEISNKAKKLAKGNFKISFDNNKILEIDELSQTLNYAKNELSRTEDFRRDLMANVSHDLKTPLTMIKAYAEIAKDLHINDKEKQKEDMHTIITETDRLTLLVNDILTLSKMETIEEKLDLEEFNLIELINNIIKKYKVLQETEKYQFIFNHKKKKIIIKADRKKLEQVIYNLINNAINYTGEDNLVTITVTNKEKITVEITDTGKGIKKEEIPYIWEKYYKNNKKHKRNLVGTGLGLNIVKKILEQHNYKYGVKSKEGKGTTFYFEINT